MRTEKMLPRWRTYRPDPALAPQPFRILLAEDDAEMRSYLARELRREGFEVVEAVDGGELLEKLGNAILGDGRSPWPNMVISDVRMPHADGIRVLEGLRARDWATPFILVTAFGSEDLHAEARRLGALCFDKPFDFDDLMTAILHIAPVR